MATPTIAAIGFAATTFSHDPCPILQSSDPDSGKSRVSLTHISHRRKIVRYNDRPDHLALPMSSKHLVAAEWGLSTRLRIQRFSVLSPSNSCPKTLRATHRYSPVLLTPTRLDRDFCDLHVASRMGDQRRASLTLPGWRASGGSTPMEAIHKRACRRSMALSSKRTSDPRR